MDLPAGILSGIYQSVGTPGVEEQIIPPFGATRVPDHILHSPYGPLGLQPSVPPGEPLEPSGQSYAPLLNYSVFAENQHNHIGTPGGTQFDLTVVKEEYSEGDYQQSVAHLVSDPKVSDFAATVLKSEEGPSQSTVREAPIHELTGVAAGEVNSLLSELETSHEFHCQACNTPMGVPASKVIGSHMVLCRRGNHFWCPVCRQQYKSADSFNLHTLTHCFSGDGKSAFCSNCSKQYLLLDDPIPPVKRQQKAKKKRTKRKQSARRKSQEGAAAKPSAKNSSEGRSSQAKSKKVQKEVRSGGLPEVAVLRPKRSSRSTVTVTKTQSSPVMTQSNTPPKKQPKTSAKPQSVQKQVHPDSAVEKPSTVVTSNGQLSWSCAVCNKSFTRSQSLVVHMRIHTGERPYSCPTCNKTFVCKSHLSSHMYTHAETRAKQCTLCGKTFVRNESLKRHLLSHSDERPFSCDRCGNTFKTSAGLRSHQTVHTGPKAHLMCSQCGKQFGRRGTLTVHLRMHTGERPYPCSICDKRFYTKSHVREHMRVHNTVRDINCPLCDMSFARPGTAKKHMLLHTNRNEFGCLECGERFDSLVNLQNHIEGHEVSMWKFSCKVCGNSFTRRDSLTVHMRLHTGERPFKCKVCPEEFYSSSKLGYHIRVAHEPRPDANLAQKKTVICPLCGKVCVGRTSYYGHMRTHTGNKPHRCEVCSKCFLTASRLKIHMRVHTGERPYKCDQCDRAFTVSSGLKVHMMQHTGERPHRCSVCGKGFIGYSKMMNHMRIHTGEKPFKCPMCDMRFRNKVNRVLHIRTHTGERPHQCQLCPKAFKWPHDLKKHQVVHTGRKDYCCDQCGKTFSRAITLRNHERKVHNMHQTYSNQDEEAFEDSDATSDEDEDYDSEDLENLVEDGIPLADVTGQEREILRQKHEMPNTFPTTSTAMDQSTLPAGGVPLMPGTPSPDQIGMAPVVPSPAMLSFLLGQLQMAMAHSGLAQDGDGAGLGMGVTKQQRDHVLLSLTILANFLSTMNFEILQFMKTNNIVDLLVHLLGSSDPFISRTAARCLAVWLRAAEKSECEAWLHRLMVRLVTDDHTAPRATLSVLDVFRLVLAKQTSQQAPLQLALESKDALFTVFMADVLTLIQKFFEQNHRSPTTSRLVTHSLLTVWGKIIKYFVTYKWQDSSHLASLTPEANMIQSINIFLLNEIEYGRVPEHCFLKAVESVNRCLPYSTKLSLDSYSSLNFHGPIAWQVLAAVQRSLLERVPLVVGGEDFGCVVYGGQGHTGRDVAPSGTGLRKAVLLVLKCVAVTLPQGDSDRRNVARLPLPITCLQTLHQHMSPASGQADAQTVTWLFDLCNDQDDILIESLLCLLDIVILTRKTSELVTAEQVEWTRATFEPHFLFLHFMDSDASWDESFLLDLIISPETCFLTYFMKYLRYTLNDWTHFTVVCKWATETLGISDEDSEGNSPLSGSSTGKKNSSALDKCMAVLIRLRFDIQKAYDKKLVGFNCAPLVRLLERCETQYEH